jgi:hypothetical protein
MRGAVKVFLAFAALLMVSAAAYAQEGQIAGIVRDKSEAVMPGVTIEVTSPALIEKTRTAVSDANGQYRLTNLPVGTYKVSFSLSGFKKEERDGVTLSSGFTASVNATMDVGQVTETVVVSGAAPVVDVQNAREVINLPGDLVKELPTSRNVNSLLELAPGIGSRYKPTGAFGAPGVCVGGIGVFCNPGIDGFNVGDTGTATDVSNLSQGRVMIDGQVVNQAGSLPLGGLTGGYTADVANAQEINIRVSGALGESETGGSEINIVPRTGGNKFSGNFNGTYTNEKFFQSNNGSYPTLPAAFQPVKNDHDVSGAFGGPILKDRLWFYSVGRDQQIRKLPVGIDFWPNLNEGKAGYNYVPNTSQSRVEYTNKWRNINARITLQASPKNKFNFFWDEQDFCQDPCDGVVSVFTSPESWFSVGIKPNRLRQASWTNPLTSKILLEAGISVNSEYYDTSHHRDFTNYTSIPRIIENGDTAGLYDPNQPGVNATCLNGAGCQRTNIFAGAPGFGLTSGSLNSELAAGGAEVRDTRTWRSRASISYVTGGHHAKFGYDGGYYTQLQQNVSNIPQMTYNYTWPGATVNCLGAAVPGGLTPCGNTSMQFPGDPLNTARRPVPTSFNYNTGIATPLDDHVKYIALYAQDQWTFRRFTASYALRYDHATSGYGSTCTGPNKFVFNSYCTQPTDGVNYNDLTPRWGVTWDVRGNGKTSVKWNMGKYLNAAGISGVYSGANPARRTVNILSRTWTDLNNDRQVNCDPMNFANNGECGAFNLFCPGTFTTCNDTTRFGRDPFGLDAAGTPIGLATTQCGRTEQGIPASVQAYCNAYGQSILNGWGERRGEWQFGLGVQHELLPRLSAEVVYNRRTYFNILVSDALGNGCDRFGAAQDMRSCQDAMLAYHSTTYDFYTVTAPIDPNLPGGGGYKILGLNDAKLAVVAPFTAQTYMPELQYTWNGVDTNFNWRAPFGIRVQGGTDTARTQRDTCYATVDAPNVRGREGAEYLAGCRTQTPWQTTVKGSATYNIPKIDVLVSTVFQSLPGVEITATATYQASTGAGAVSQIVWNSDSASRATAACTGAAAGQIGCLGSARTTTTVGVPLLLNQELWGQRVTEWDLKFAKNIRFAGKRLMIGIDCYNFFNSDAVTGYNTTYTLDATGKAPAASNVWGQPTGLVSPRFFRGQIQFDF